MRSAPSLSHFGGTSAHSRPLIGVVGSDLPRQIVLAAGAVPQRLFGSWSGAVSPRASELLGAVDAVAGRILDAILAGEHDDLVGLVICNDSQANLRMFYVLRVLAERGEVPFPVQLLDAPRGPGAAKRAFVVAQYARLVDFCGQVTGSTVGIEDLRRAGGVEQNVAVALERMRERRAGSRCTGVAALNAYRIAACSAPDVAIAAVDDAAIDDAQGPVGEGKRIFVTGSAHPDSTVYQELERAGVAIVAEDHDAGDAGWFAACPTGDSAADILAGLASLHAERPPSAARGTTAERVTALRRRVVETRSTAVIALVRDLDDAPAWELSSFRAALDAVSVPFASRVQIAVDGAISASLDAVSALASMEGVRR
ncbi:2-hydroxyacyl-CoA dehydratase [Microbacterium sp. A84]|uniref:2-hydroxyacyl-CoA dehydratase n=1 Tax=Microbacterium sp. A84 TaxID=3450715 RepID=UPI003F4450B1